MILFKTWRPKMATIHLTLFWTVHSTTCSKLLFITSQQDLTSKHGNYYLK